MRNAFAQDLKQAIKSKDLRRTSTLRLINAAIKDRDIEARSSGKEMVSNDEILQILAKLVKQRQESVKVYTEAGRDDLAQQEAEEIEIISAYLPKKLTDDELADAITAAISSAEAEGLRDMGKVMTYLKENYAGQIDFGNASGKVKAALSG